MSLSLRAGLANCAQGRRQPEFLCHPNPLGHPPPIAPVLVLLIEAPLAFLQWQTIAL
jgi:hypothetical protein